ncbi:MAG: hypothetical protein JST59_22955 [Actinobacteria bacterium]|nr:hypothetical protein [Actinomycetota bacterium]
MSRLSIEELQAALAHERYHVLSLDPLRSTLTQAAVAALFFLPAVRTLRRRYETERELTADRYAAALVGRRALASAMRKALDGAPGPWRCSPGFLSRSGAPPISPGSLNRRGSGKAWPSA